MTGNKAKKAAAKAAAAATTTTTSAAIPPPSPSQWKGKSKATMDITAPSKYCGGVSIAGISTSNDSASSSSSASPGVSHAEIEAWIEAEYRRRSENAHGKVTCLPNLGLLQREFEQQCPSMRKVIFDTLVGIEKRQVSKLSITNPINSHIASSSGSSSTMRPSIPASQQAAVVPGDDEMTPRHASMPIGDFVNWTLAQYADEGFGSNGAFLGYDHINSHLETLTKEIPQLTESAISIIMKLRVESVRQDFDVDQQTKYIKSHGAVCLLQKLQDLISGSPQSSNAIDRISPTRTNPDPAQSSSSANIGFTAPILEPSSVPTQLDLGHHDSATTREQPPKRDLLARKLDQLSDSSVSSTEDDDWSDVGTGSSLHSEWSMDMLLPDMSRASAELRSSDGIKDQIRNAPLLTSNMDLENDRSMFPQYGLLGSHENAKLFLNTDVPFSAFICGVQGSGKSHTTSCILENSLIRSELLGHLESPLSALVFSYGQFGGDGSGFSISEAAFLADPSRNVPGGNHVKKIQVLVSPSNYININKLYSRVPNVSVSAFKLKPHNLDIEVMLTLMNVSGSNAQPLYMAAVTQILREMATKGGDFNYLEFKVKLEACPFNPAQKDMLQLRLDLLESFLDLDNTSAELRFREGELTIMDMSCPFIDANTACIMFRIGLQRYLQSEAAGKMIVLDEAHKYMSPTPGSTALIEAIRSTVRLQRHYGARLVISTQEPTLLTDLIALCSITVLHRFSSPEWFAAIKKHIPMAPGQYQATMVAIEGLETGMALVYSPSAVLGQHEDRRLVKGAGKLLEVRMRKRITRDGGQSLLAV